MVGGRDNDHQGQLIHAALRDQAMGSHYPALFGILPLVDASGKDTYGGGTKERFKKLIRDNQHFIFWYISGLKMLLRAELDWNGQDLADVLYTLRCSLTHECDNGVVFTKGYDFILRRNPSTIEFNADINDALLLMLCYLPCNTDHFRVAAKLAPEASVIGRHRIPFMRLAGLGMDKARGVIDQGLGTP